MISTKALRTVVLAIVLVSFSLLSAQGSKASKTVSKATLEEQQLQQIKQTVKSNQGQLTKIYTRESAIFAQGGMLKITLYISEKGKVADAEVKVASGKFTSTLIKAVKAKVLEWKFNNKTKMIYTFTLRLSKN